MARVTCTVVATLLLAAPLGARAHGAGGHAADPRLHVDPSVEECSVALSPDLTQTDFRRFVREFGSLSSYKQIAPPTPLGRWDVAVGLEYASFEIEEHAGAWNDTFVHPDATHELGSRQSFPKLELRLGVGGETDVGAFYTRNPSANYGWVGVTAKHRLLRESEGMPVAVSVAAAYTKTLHVDDVDMHAATAAVSVGKTLGGVVTPYVGAGSDAVLARETSSSVELDTVAVLVPHALAGLEVTPWRHLALGAEVQLATVPSVQARVAAVF